MSEGDEVVTRSARGHRVLGRMTIGLLSPYDPQSPPPSLSVTPWQSELLSSIPGVAHGLTRRVEGLGLAHGNVGFSPPRDRDDGWAMRRRWCAALDLVPEYLVTLGQIHGYDVRIATTAGAGYGARAGSTQIGLGDTLVTNQIDPVLMTLHADCQPVLVVDPGAGRRGPVVGVAHAGWRGIVADIVGATLAVMISAFGTRADDIHVVVGPAIGRCYYDVGEDVVESWRQTAGADAGEALATDGQRHWFSLATANALLLNRAGVRAANAEVSEICTKCNGDHWFSHRGQGAQTGRFGAMISIEGG
ncbi:MAG TPA: polyphenol oxidase family protein [Thermomicrobiales bacterium]|nr:polyphenol oxidase family protein [Thermomicrobiales bacterium]